MLLTIHDANLQKIGFIDNEKQETLNFYNDTWTRNLGTASSTFEFTVSKKQLLSDTANKPLYNQLNERSFVSFKHKGQTYLFNIMKVEENERWIRCYCENLNLELINEYTNPYKADRPLSFAEYLDVFEIPQFAMVKIGVNEISDQKRTLEWEGQDTKLARLLSLANKFDAEVEFVTQLNDDSSIKQLVLNVYHKADDSHTGVGRIRGDIRLTFEKNIKSMTRKIDKTEVYTLVVPYGKSKESHEGEQEVRVYIDNLPPWEEKDDNGIVIFKQEGVNLYAPHAADLYPSTFGVSTQSNKWIRKDLEVDSDNPNVIRAAGIANLRKHAYPAITYEVDGFIDVEIGDTITIHDKGFTPALDVRARAVEQKISFSNPTNNKTTFGNFKELENRTSGDLRSVFEQMVENIRPYNILVSTDNGVLFKNNTGQSTLRPTLKRGNQVINATYRFVIDGSIVSSGLTYTVKASDITKPTVITISAWVGNKEVASEEVTFLNVSDGKQGPQGPQGPKGADGRTPYIHTAWAYSADGTDRFTTVYPNLNLIDGTRDFSGNWNRAWAWQTDGTYKGLIVKKRTDLWKGIDKTFTAPKNGTYTFSAYIKCSGNTANPARHINLNGFWDRNTYKTYGNNFDWLRDSFSVKLKTGDTIAARYEISGKGTLWTAGHKWEEGSTATPWMPSASEVTTDDYPKYIGQYTNYNQVDSPNPQDYTWSLIRGNDGADGKTPYVHFAYADSADGRTGFSLTQTGSKRYLGVYTDFNQADSTNPSDYTWNDTAGSISVGGRNLLNGSKGPFKPDRKPTTNFDNIGLYQNETSVYLEENKNYIVSAKTDGIFTSTHNPSVDSDNVVLWLYRPWDVWKLISDSKTGTTGTQFIWDHPTGTYHLRVNTYHKEAIKSVWEVKIEEGTVKTDWTPSVDDVQKDIDSKADDALTQAQLNRLSEINSVMKAELEAKASLATVNQWIKAYQDFVNANSADRAQAQKALADASARVVKLENNLNDMSERWNFIDNYMAASNDGLVIGKKDNSSSIMFNPNGRISMFSAGNEVMYISQGVIHIENGIFSKTIQIGRFREEQDFINPDRNVIRYAGGI
ncbi:virion structural protein [Streptococcus phage CHPC869]|uniref:Capsid and scaffold protein n=1 Tax=Streptococcus phage CHPC869 TaxID=2365041 RepID=A0A3G8F730_9CAUD|nr:virion structural protein [Streptococcus phage CHPC869]AZF90573.1 capsid and scaffold protein [Streptococcus phage CHPC869]